MKRLENTGCAPAQLERNCAIDRDERLKGGRIFRWVCGHGGFECVQAVVGCQYDPATVVDCIVVVDTKFKVTMLAKKYRENEIFRRAFVTDLSPREWTVKKTLYNKSRGIELPARSDAAPMVAM
jgi:hypothetical protein